MDTTEAADRKQASARPSTPVAVRTGLGLLLCAAVGLLLGLDAAWPQGYVWAACGVVVVGIALDEFAGMAVQLEATVLRRPLVLGGVAIFLLHWAGAAFPALPDSWAMLAAALALATLFVLTESVLSGRIEGGLQSISAHVMGLAYVPLLFAFATSVRVGWGLGAVIAMLAVCKGSSSSAYFAGKTFGRRKMVPRLSPKKTWAGAVGQFAGALLVAAALSVPPWRLMSLRAALVYGVLVAAAALVGDLAASLLKRQSGIKDWGHLLPGFGGMLDMLDDVLFVGPVTFLFLVACDVMPTGG